MGNTYIWAEGLNNQGTFWQAGGGYIHPHGLQLSLHAGWLSYFTDSPTRTRQLEIAAHFPLRWVSEAFE